MFFLLRKSFRHFICFLMFYLEFRLTGKVRYKLLCLLFQMMKLITVGGRTYMLNDNSLLLFGFADNTLEQRYCRNLF
jgi:hypothetical protein